MPNELRRLDPKSGIRCTVRMTRPSFSTFADLRLTGVTNCVGSRIFRHQNRRSMDRFSLLLVLKCCFTCTETVGLLGTGAQDVHLDFHTVPELCIDLARPSSVLKEGTSWQLWLLNRGDVNFCVRGAPWHEEGERGMPHGMKRKKR